MLFGDWAFERTSNLLENNLFQTITHETTGHSWALNQSQIH
jgi:hypothetical protein